MKGYITVQEAAQKWGITPRQVQILCKEKRVISATRISSIQIIPENVEKLLWSSIFVTLVAKKYHASVTQLPALHVE